MDGLEIQPEFVMARFVAMWRIYVMHDWTSWESYAYCKKCGRPLSDYEWRIQISTHSDDSGRKRKSTTYYCRLCESRAVKPSGSSDASTFWVLIGISVFVVCYGEFGPEEFTVFGKLLTYFVPTGAALWMFFLPWWDKLKYKPIYDRWVKLHGTDPEYWPRPSRPK